MNKAGMLGMITAMGILAFAISDSTKNAKIFLDPHGIVIVVGGTLTVALLSFSFRKLYLAFKVFLRKMLGREKDDYMGTIKLIVELAEVYRANPKNLEATVPANAHPFLKDAIKLIVGYGFSADEVDEILGNALKGKSKRDEEENRVWHTIARFPPAFGLLGATLGMIALLQTLGEPGAQDRIGPAMATALVATFYGLVVANLFLLPIAEKLAAVATSDKNVRVVIKAGMVMMVEKRHPTFIAEYLQSYLSPTQKQLAEGAPRDSKRGARAA